ncbi:MAG: LicD family protein [Desulfovibrionaceae bacterium]|nr:LicD family protein [Desulfovibrionaceae bacterium]
MTRNGLSAVMLRLLWNRRSYPSRSWIRSLRGCRGSLTAAAAALYGQACLLCGKHQRLLSAADRHPVLRFYAAQSCFLRGLPEEGLAFCSQVLTDYPGHLETVWLQSRILADLNRKEEAFTLLSQFADQRKAWIRMAGLVESPEDFAWMKRLRRRATQDGRISWTDATVLDYMALAAQRCGLYDEAFFFLNEIQANGLRLQSKHARISEQAALEALSDLTHACRSHQIDLFLISGTLLGFIRNGTFLPHDFDIDTGVFEQISPEQLKKTVQSAGRFEILPQRTSRCLKIRHVNGTPIDIFTHFRKNDDIFHGVLELTWHNTPFSLKPACFLGLDILIPDNPERYLRENYGPDWQRPVTQFDSASDCPNSTVENAEELRIRLYRSRLNQLSCA